MKLIGSATVRGFSGIGICVILLARVGALAAAEPISTNASVAPSVALPSSPTAAPSPASRPNYSYAVTEVIKMKDANVSPEVIKDFIQVSVSPFQPGAADIIALKQRGVSEDLIQAMLRRDGQLQITAASAPPQQAPPGQQVIPMTQPAPSYGAAVQPSTVYYSQPVAEYSSYYDYYPSYYPSYAYAGWGWGLGWGWPGYGYYGNRHVGYYGGYRGPVRTGGFGGHPGGWGSGRVVGGHVGGVGGHVGGVGGHVGGVGGHAGSGGHRGR